MPKQGLDVIDYFGALAAWVLFFSVIFIISVTCILWLCVNEHDDSTVFAKWGMGPRHRSSRNEYAMAPLVANREKERLELDSL